MTAFDANASHLRIKEILTAACNKKACAIYESWLLNELEDNEKEEVVTPTPTPTQTQAQARDSTTTEALVAVTTRTLVIKSLRPLTEELGDIMLNTRPNDRQTELDLANDSQLIDAMIQQCPGLEMNPHAIYVCIRTAFLNTRMHDGNANANADTNASTSTKQPLRTMYDNTNMIRHLNSVMHLKQVLRCIDPLMTQLTVGMFHTKPEGSGGGASSFFSMLFTTATDTKKNQMMRDQLCGKQLFLPPTKHSKHTATLTMAMKSKCIGIGCQFNQFIDRAIGSMVGMGIGDAFGHPLEFIPVLDIMKEMEDRPRFSYVHRAFYNEFNKFRLQRGQWTDDASMGLCMADSLIIQQKYDGSDIRIRFWNWWQNGYNNAFRKDEGRSGSCGLGGNISSSIYNCTNGEIPSPRFEVDHEREDSGNGSLMRLAPIPIFFHANVEDAIKYSFESSFTTHPGYIAAEACALLSYVIVSAIHAPTNATGNQNQNNNDDSNDDNNTNHHSGNDDSAAERTNNAASNNSNIDNSGSVAIDFVPSTNVKQFMVAVTNNYRLRLENENAHIQSAMDCIKLKYIQQWKNANQDESNNSNNNGNNTNNVDIDNDIEIAEQDADVTIVNKTQTQTHTKSKTKTKTKPQTYADIAAAAASSGGHNNNNNNNNSDGNANNNSNGNGNGNGNAALADAEAPPTVGYREIPEWRLLKRQRNAKRLILRLIASAEDDRSKERCWNWKNDYGHLGILETYYTRIGGKGTVRKKRYNGYPVSPGYWGSYCMDGLAMALHCVYHSSCFADAIEKCINLLGDADSTGSIGGQIAGAVYGYSSILNDPQQRFLVESLNEWDDQDFAFRGLLLFVLGDEALKNQFFAS